jgi:PAS domain S-box-containing protein
MPTRHPLEEDLETLRRENTRLKAVEARYHQFEEVVRQREGQYQALLANLPDIISRVDRNRKYLYISPSIVSVTGKPPEAYIGRPIDEPDSSEQALLWQAAVEKVLQTGQAEEIEFMYPGPQGERAYQLRVVPEIIDGVVVGALSISQDITERKRYEQTLNQDISDRKRAEEELVLSNERLQRQTDQMKQQAQELARSNADLEQFAYIASHDLQEPLRTVSSYTQLLARRYKGKLDADADDFIAFAVDGTARMQTLIKDLLTYSRVGTRGGVFESTDCQQVLKTTLANLEGQIQETNATITHDPLPTLAADASQLGQVFQNLLSNALKFYDEQPPHVHIGAERQGQEWVFSVRDNGIGIEAQYAERIFEIFQRLHNKSKYSGTGIGLAVCKKIVERHGGRIWMESEPDRGTTFFFTLPLQAKAAGEH